MIKNYEVVEAQFGPVSRVDLLEKLPQFIRRNFAIHFGQESFNIFQGNTAIGSFEYSTRFWFLHKID